MALRLNSAMRSKIVASGVLDGLGTDAILKIYGGAQPLTGGGETAETPLVQISGISWSAPTNGTSILSGATFSGTAGTDGTATWARLSDTSGAAYVLDGACGTSALNEFVIDNEVVNGTSVVTLTSATIVQPAS